MNRQENQVIVTCPFLIFDQEPSHVVSGSLPSKGDFILFFLIQSSFLNELPSGDLNMEKSVRRWGLSCSMISGLITQVSNQEGSSSTTTQGRDSIYDVLLYFPPGEKGLLWHWGKSPTKQPNWRTLESSGGHSLAWRVVKTNTNLQCLCRHMIFFICLDFLI